MEPASFQETLGDCFTMPTGISDCQKSTAKAVLFCVNVVKYRWVMNDVGKTK